MFENMKANILSNNTLCEEPIAVRNIWKKGHNCYFDILFHDSGRTKVLDASYIHDIYDLDTLCYYKDMALFARDFEEERQKIKHDAPVREQKNRLWNEDKAASRYRYLDEIRPEITILKFFASLNPNQAEVKQRVIMDYIKDIRNLSTDFSQQYIEAFIQTLPAGENDFYDSLEKIENRHEDHIERLVREAVKISAADGAIHYEEKRCLAELLQSLREHGIEPDIEF